MTVADRSVFLTPKEVAARLRVTADTLCVWRTRKIGPPFIKRCKRVYYNAQALDHWFMNGDPLDQ